MSRFTVLLGQLLGKTKISPQTMGIDLGSNMTRLKLGQKIVFAQPTCIAFHPASRSVLAIGQTAYNMVGKSADQVEIVFPIRRGKVADLTAAQFFLRAALEPFMPQLRVLQPLVLSELSLAVPANSTQAQRSFYRQALSGSGYFRLNYQYKVSAIARAIHTQLPQLIIDLGGQTTEVAICQADQVLAKKTIPLGGDDFTQLLIQAIRTKLMCEVGWQTAEKIKAEIGLVPLGEKNTKTPPLLTVARGKDVVTNLPKTIQVSSQEILDEYRSLANTLLLYVREVCDLAPAELLTQALEQGVYCTGGSSLLRQLPEFLAEGMGTMAILAKSPQSDVIKGLE